MKYILISSLLAVTLLSSCQVICTNVPDSRSLMLDASRKSDPNFPKKFENKELIKFAHLGSVKTPTGPLHVVEVRWCLTGMLAPRGFTQISFFTPDFKYVGSQCCNGTYPIRCFGPYVLLWGKDSVGDKIGNAWDLSRGFDCRTLVHAVDNEFGEH